MGGPGRAAGGQRASDPLPPDGSRCPALGGGLLIAPLWSALVTGDLATLQGLVLATGPYGALAIVGLMMVHTLLPFPAEVVTLLAGAIYGPWIGLLLSWLGAMAGGLLGFALVRWAGRPLLRRGFAPRARELASRWTRSNAVWALLVLRLLPFVSFNLVNYAAGLSDVDAPTFVWTLAVGILPADVLLSVTGAQAVHGLSHVLLPLAGFVALVAAGHWLWRRRA